jgi:hypothetical protein
MSSMREKIHCLVLSLKMHTKTEVTRSGFEWVGDCYFFHSYFECLSLLFDGIIPIKSSSMKCEIDRLKWDDGFFFRIKLYVISSRKESNDQILNEVHAHLLIIIVDEIKAQFKKMDDKNKQPLRES